MQGEFWKNIDLSTTATIMQVLSIGALIVAIKARPHHKSSHKSAKK